MTDLTVELAGVQLPNPVMTAAGCAGLGRELDRFLEIDRLGAFVTPTVAVTPTAGTDTPRVAETASGVLAATGRPTAGVAAFVDHDLPWLESAGARVIVSVGGSSSTEFAHIAAALRASAAFGAVVAIEVNLACVNAANRGLIYAADPLAAGKVVALVREQLPRDTPVFAKLTPDVTEVTAVASACAKAGADGLTLINAPGGVAIDPLTLNPRLSAVYGRLSGPAIRPLAVRAIWQVRSAMIEGRIRTIPIIGVGGIASGADALELIAAGASAVQVGSACFSDPLAPRRVTDELQDLLTDHGFDSLDQAVGVAHPNRHGGLP